jgi:hypothetical protein
MTTSSTIGLSGMAFALRAVHRLLGDRSADQTAARALEFVRSPFDGERWSDQFELLGGNAGIALGAARAGDLDLAVTALTPYLRRGEATAGGPGLAGPGQAVLAHRHSARHSASAAAGILGQQRPLLRHSRRRPGSRPQHSETGRPKPAPEQNPIIYTRSPAQPGCCGAITRRPGHSRQRRCGRWSSTAYS